MKKIVFVVVFLTMLSSVCQAEDISYLQSAMWRIAADTNDYVSAVATRASNLDLNYRGHISINVLVDWLKIELGQPNRLDRVYPNSVYELFLSKYDEASFHYANTVVVADDHLPPQNVQSSGSDISCDDPGTTVRLFKWDTSQQLFLDQEVTPTCTAGTCTFSGIASGTYVLGYTGNELPSLAITIN